MLHKKPNTGIRFASLICFFTLLCAAFVVALAVVKIKGPQTDYSPDSDNVRVVTVSGVRGQIYDRNGTLLVGNSTSYDLIYEYGAMPSRADAINEELLGILRALELAGETDKLADDHFPLEGVYPSVRFSAAAKDSASEEHRYLMNILEKNALAEDTSAYDLAQYYIDRYNLTSDKYSSAEIMSLMRLWYEMNKVGFGSYQAYTVARGVSEQLMTIINESGILGATLHTVSQSVYQYPGVAAHILGQVGKISAETAEHYTSLGYSLDSLVGKSGVELAFEGVLHGQDGKMVIKYDEFGSITERYYENPPVSGNDVWLTIDIDLQIAAEQGLSEMAQSIEGSGGGAITALDPRNGEILAIASYPTYDLSQISNADYYASLLSDAKTPLLNRALTGVYAPGSTYKVGVALAALECGIIDTSTHYTCTGSYDGITPHPGCLESHGSFDVFEAIQESCNVFFYNIGHALGLESVTAYTERLGLGSPTGIELGEREGTVAGPEYSSQNKAEWTEAGDVLGAIGQSDHGYTPLQLGVYMASIVNGGTRHSAHLLNSVRHFYTKQVVSEYSGAQPTTVSFSDSTYSTLITSMGRVVSENAEVRHYFSSLPVAVGGKTGTAEVGGHADNALFAGFAPLNSPRIVVSCVIEEGLHGYYAAGACSKLLEKYFEKYPE